MEILTALTLLVAVIAWLAAAYARLQHLYRDVQFAWKKWYTATRHRNECLSDFVAVFAGFLPQENMLPRDMRKWTEDSSRALEALPGAPIAGTGHLLENAEQELRRIMTSSGHTIENAPRLRECDQLLGLYQAMTISRNQQEEEGRFYNRSAHIYNSALDEPLTRLLAPLLGFSPVEVLSSTRQTGR